MLPFSHWQRFIQGLSVFALGLLLMVAGAWWLLMFYYAGLIILLGGFAWAMSGYAGLLWHRLTKSINPHKRK